MKSQYRNVEPDQRNTCHEDRSIFGHKSKYKDLPQAKFAEKFANGLPEHSTNETTYYFD